MSLTENSSGLVMPVSPMYGGGMGSGFGSGFGGGDGWFILLILLLAGNGWGNGFGGFGGGNELYPWLNNSQNVNDGFRDSMLNSNVTSIRDGISALSTQLCGCCGDIQNALCNGFAGVNSTVSNGFAQAEIAENGRQMANMNQIFGLSTQLAQASSDNRLGIANLGSDIAREACADRQAVNDGVMSINANITQGIQTILTQMCNDKIDQKNEKIADLERQLTMANLTASHTAQNAFISQGFANEVDALYNRLNSCPVPTTPVYGRTPIFTCNQNAGCGCGCGNF